MSLIEAKFFAGHVLCCNRTSDAIGNEIEDDEEIATAIGLSIKVVTRRKVWFWRLKVGIEETFLDFLRSDVMARDVRFVFLIPTNWVIRNGIEFSCVRFAS